MTIASEITDLQTNLANAKAAVTTMGGTVGDTGLAGLADEIETIPTGGETSDDVRFIDYDGTIVAQMSIAEAQALTELPAGPTHADLEFKGWTHTLQEVKGTNHILDVGAMYAYASDNTATIVKFRPITNQSATVAINQDIADGVQIDWGDNTTPETSSTTGSVTLTHTYTVASDTPITAKITLLNPATTLEIDNLSFGDAADLMVIGKAEPTAGLGSKIIIFSPQAVSVPSLNSNKVLEHIVIPNTITTLATFNGDSRLDKIVLPNSIQSVTGTQPFGACWNLKRLVLPERLATILDVQSCYSLKQYECSNCTATSIGQYYFRYSGLREFVVPTTITSIASRAFNQSQVQRIKFGNISELPSIDTTAFSWLQEMDFTECTEVPYAANLNFTSYNQFTIKFYVPQNLLAQWKAAPVWSDVADQIIGV